MDITPYKLSDAAFWANSDRGADPIPNKLIGDYSGVLIDAPKRVLTDHRKTLPAGLYHLGSAKELAAVSFHKYGVLTAMDVIANRLYTVGGRVLKNGAEARAKGPVDPDLIPPGDLCVAQEVQLREVFDLPWKSGRYLITAMLRDKVSNRAPIELSRSQGSYEDPAVLLYLQQLRSKKNPPTIFPVPSPPFPSFKKLPQSPPIPKAPGIVLKQQRVVDLKRDPRSPLYGSFQLPVLAQEILKPDFQDPYYLSHPKEPKPTAIVGITLMITGADDGGVASIPLHVPTFDAISWIPPDGDLPMVTGYFNLNLLRLPRVPRIPQTYFLYAFSGASMAGPYPTAVVDLED
jgi:hypothetical protein